MQFGVFPEQFRRFNGAYGNHLPRQPLWANYPKPTADAIVTKRGDIIVLHFAGQMTLAGIAWQTMHYLVGLESLGHRCWYFLQRGATPCAPRAHRTDTPRYHTLLSPNH